MYVCMYVCMGFPTNHTRPFIKVIGVSIRGVHGLDLVGLNHELDNFFLINIIVIKFSIKTILPRIRVNL